MSAMEQLLVWSNASQRRKHWFQDSRRSVRDCNVMTETGKRLSVSARNDERAAELMLKMLKAQGLA